MIRTFSFVYNLCLFIPYLKSLVVTPRSIHAKHFQTRLVVRFASVLTVSVLRMHISLRMSPQLAPMSSFLGTHYRYRYITKTKTKIRVCKVAYSRPRCKIRTGTPTIRIPWCVGLLGPLIARAYSSSERARGTE